MWNQEVNTGKVEPDSSDQERKGMGKKGDQDTGEDTHNM